MTEAIEIRIGAYRNVLLTGGYAVKLARADSRDEGVEHNRREADRWRDVDDARRQILCPVHWISTEGEILVMQRAAEIPEREFDWPRTYALIEPLHPGIDCTA
jgi:hypothetical protein